MSGEEREQGARRRPPLRKSISLAEEEVTPRHTGRQKKLSLATPSPSCSFAGLPGHHVFFVNAAPSKDFETFVKSDKKQKLLR